MTTPKQKAKAEADHAALVTSIREGSGRGLSLDLSSKTMGYGVWHQGVVVERDTIIIGTDSTPIETRLYNARANFCRLLECWNPVLVVCEGPSLHSPALAIIAQAKVKAVCLLTALDKGVPFPDKRDGLAPKSVKKTFVGNGNADKEPMIQQAKILLGLGRDDTLCFSLSSEYDEHVADAIAVGYAAGFSRIALDMLFQPMKPTKKGKATK